MPDDTPGTQPLKRGKDDKPRATILTDANQPNRPPLSIDQDTERVRIVPDVPDPPPWRVIFHTVDETPAVIGLDVRESVIMGRSDPEDEHQPDIDLAGHMALERGVSREHAALIPTPEALYVLDLESKNGTWHNGNYVDPNERVPLSPGDNLELGLMRLVVRTVTRIDR